MQYKIPIQIENEDVIVLGLSMRQIIIMMLYGGIGYTIFKSMAAQTGPEIALVFALPIIGFGAVVALLKVSEMTFLPIVLNMLRLSLNTRERAWSKGTDSYPEIEIGYITRIGQVRETSGLNKGSIYKLIDKDSSDQFSKL